MSVQYGYYIPLSESLYESVLFLSISPKLEGPDKSYAQKVDKDGTPAWVITALVKFQGGKPETENFTLVATQKTAEEIAKLKEITPIALVGLSGGKWSKAGSDKTAWSFQINGLQVRP